MPLIFFIKEQGDDDKTLKYFFLFLNYTSYSTQHFINLRGYLKTLQVKIILRQIQNSIVIYFFIRKTSQVKIINKNLQRNRTKLQFVRTFTYSYINFHYILKQRFLGKRECSVLCSGLLIGIYIFYYYSGSKAD